MIIGVLKGVMALVIILIYYSLIEVREKLDKIIEKGEGEDKKCL